MIPRLPIDPLHPLGRRGADAPTGPAPTVDRARIRDLVALSLRGLERQHDPARQALFSQTFENRRGRPVRDEHLGLRYTVMSSLGVHEAKAAGFQTSLDGAALLRSGLAQFPSEDIDHLAMALWADCTVQAGVGEGLVPRLLRALDGGLDRTIGRVLAWALTALSLHAERDDDPRVKAAALRLRDVGANQCWHADSQLFDHFPGGDPHQRTQALFSTQIYWVYALATYGRVFDDALAVQTAEQAMERLIALRDPFGGWPWRYDARRGVVVERYPVYSVHQDAMAPMAMHQLTRATGRSYVRIHQESLGWLWRNELGLSMVDPEHQVIYRAIRRAFPLNRAAYGAGRAIARFGQRTPVADRPWFLRLNRTCRPYHLGWVLHAWAPHLHLLPE